MAAGTRGELTSELRRGDALIRIFRLQGIPIRVLDRLPSDYPRRPVYALASPPPLLAPFVEHFWIVDIPGGPRIDRVLPDGLVNLMFNWGASHRLYALDDLDSWTLTRRAWISGMRADPIAIGPTDGTRMAGIRFKPGGLYPFLQTPAVEFAARVVELDEVLGRDAELVAERLGEAPDHARRFAILERFLMDRAGDALRTDRRVAHCVSHLHVRSVGDLTRELGISNKHLNRLFRRHVGTNPKTLARVQRFQGVVCSLQGAAGPHDWAGVALDHGYYDQAHMITEFKACSGLTPTQYAAADVEALNFVPIRAD